VNLALVAVGGVALLVAIVTVSLKPTSWFERGYDARALRDVVTQVDEHPGVRIFANGHFGDWLLWKEPRLAGRVAYDSRFELLTQSQLNGLGHLSELLPPRSPDLVAGYGLLVLDRGDQAETQSLLQRSGARVIMAGRGVEVAARSGA
jgi:hypothetical protein